MIKYLLLFYLSICVFPIAFSQSPQDLLPQLRDKYKLEKISLHTDKSYYLAGDTIWFKAYVMADDHPSIESSKISVSLINDSNKTVTKLILPIIYSSAVGNIQLPNDMRGGTYSLQAFTDYMAVRDKEHFYNRSIQIASIISPVVNKEIDFQPTVQFFAESGIIIDGIYNSIAFKCTDQFGYPINGRGTIIDGDGNDIHSFEASHNGMGKLRIKPIENQTYQAKILFENGVVQSFPLPASKTTGVGFESSISMKEIVAEINCTRLLSEAWRPSYMLLTENNILIARNDLPAKEMLTVKIPTNFLPTGILKVAIFSASHQPLLERIFFINNDNYSLEANFKILKKSLEPGGKQIFEINVDDTLNTNLSIAVVDAAYDSTTSSTTNIVSDLLLTEELKGYVHDPTQYFYKNDIITKRNVDLVMMTNGWRRYNWEKIMKGYLPNFPEVKKGYISFQGNLVDKETNKPIDGGSLPTIFKNKKGILGNINIPIDSVGNFALNDLIASDTITIDVLGAYNKYLKKIDLKNLQMKITSMPISAGLTISPLVTLKNRSTFKLPEERLKYYNELGLDKVVTLSNVKIEANKRWENTTEINDKYTRGSLFTSGELRSYDFVSDPIKGNTTQNLFNYAIGRFAGITLGRRNGDDFFIFRSSFSLAGGSSPMTIVIDNVEAPASTLKTIPVSDIALVKIYSSNLLFSTQSGGLMAVFTKRGEDRNTNGAASDKITLNIEGYSSVKEFYNPDDLAIEKARINKKPDNRSTIYWNPMIRLNEDNKNVALSFYNSDAAKKYRVIVQGFNSAGKLYYLEKIIE